MKNLIIVGGTAGVGKTTTCRELQRILLRNVFLDGDWCWDMRPFVVTEETKAMVNSNIAHLLNGFLACSEFENVIFCWVLHEQHILDNLISVLNLNGCTTHCFSLVSTEQALVERLNRDIAAGKRDSDITERSVAGIPLYDKLDTVKIDVSTISPADAARRITERMAGVQANADLIAHFPSGHYETRPEALPVEIDFSIGERGAMLRDGRADVGLLHSPQNDLTGLDAEELITERQVVVLPEHHRLARLSSICLTDLVGETMPRWPGQPGSAGDGPVVRDAGQLMQLITLGRMVVVVPESVRSRLHARIPANGQVGGSPRSGCGMSGTCGAGEAGGEHAQVSGELWRLVHLEFAAGQHQAEGQPFQGVGMGFQPADPLVHGGEVIGGDAQAAGHLRGRRVQRPGVHQSHGVRSGRRLLPGPADRSQGTRSATVLS